MTEQCTHDPCLCQRCPWKSVCRHWLNECFEEKECTACFALGNYHSICTMQKAIIDMKHRGFNITPKEITDGACRF